MCTRKSPFSSVSGPFTTVAVPLETVQTHSDTSVGSGVLASSELVITVSTFHFPLEVSISNTLASDGGIEGSRESIHKMLRTYYLLCGYLNQSSKLNTTSCSK